MYTNYSGILLTETTIILEKKSFFNIQQEPWTSNIETLPKLS